MLKLYITRHGETEWNVQKRMQGWQDSSLTEKGKENATRLGKSLQNIKFDAVYASTSPRAVDTAKLITGEQNVTIVTNDQLREIHMGEWEGKTHEEIKQMYPEQHHHFWGDTERYEPIGGETFDELMQRVISMFNMIVSKHESGNVLIVTHTVFLKGLLLLVKGKAITNMWDPPFLHGTSLTVLEVDGDQYHIHLEGDTSHFSEEVNV